MFLFRFLICLFIFPFLLSGQSGSIIYFYNDIFSVPAGITTITVEVLGSGGRGGFVGGGGGGGGGFAKGVYSVTPFSTLQVIVGSYSAKSAVVPLIQATNGKSGSLGDTINFTAFGGQGGIGTGGNIINRSGGNGGAGYPGYFGGGGGGAGGIKGNGQNGENAPSFDSNSGKLDLPVAKGGAGAGGVTSTAGQGGGYHIASNYNSTFTIDVPATSGFGFGGGGGGSNGGSNPSDGAQGYCFISWGNSCQSPAPLFYPYNNNDPRFCQTQTCTVEATGYDTLEWFTDTLSIPFAKGKIITTPVLTNSFETLYIRTSGCPQNQFVSLDVYPSPTINVVPKFSDTTLCWGEQCQMEASGCNWYQWESVPGYNSYGGYFQNNSTCPKDTTIIMELFGYSNNGGCPDSAFTKVHLRPKVAFSFIASPTHFCWGDTVTLTAFGPAIKTFTWYTGETSKQIKIKADDRPYFNVTGLDSLGCKADAFLELHNLSPVVNIVHEEKSTCVGDSILLVAMGAATYTWSFGGTTNPTWLKPKAKTTYTVTGSAFGCTDTTIFSLNVSLCTDVSDLHSKKGFDVYPNPTSGRILFDLNSATTIKMIKADGTAIRLFPLPEGKQTVDLDVPSGVYFLSVTGFPPKKIIVTE